MSNKDVAHKTCMAWYEGLAQESGTPMQKPAACVGASAEVKAGVEAQLQAKAEAEKACNAIPGHFFVPDLFHNDQEVIRFSLMGEGSCKPERPQWYKEDVSG